MIEELRKKYADKKFIDTVFPEVEVECGTTVTSLDDFLSLGDVFFCQEKVIRGDDTAKDMADNVFIEALTKVENDLGINLSNKDDANDSNKADILHEAFVKLYNNKKNFKKVLSKCTASDETLTIMKNPEYNVYYCERSNAASDDPNLSHAIDELSAELKKTAEDEIAKYKKENMIKDTNELFKSYREAYSNASTLDAREKIVHEVKSILDRDYSVISADYDDFVISSLLSLSCLGIL